MKRSLLVMMVCLAGCSWFHAKKPPAPVPPQLIVTGAPTGSILFVDGVQAHPANEDGKRPQVIQVAPGTHTVEVHAGDSVAYRENLDVDFGEKRVVSVLSGSNRN